MAGKNKSNNILAGILHQKWFKAIRFFNDIFPPLYILFVLWATELKDPRTLLRSRTVSALDYVYSSADIARTDYLDVIKCHLLGLAVHKLAAMFPTL